MSNISAVSLFLSLSLCAQLCARSDAIPVFLRFIEPRTNGPSWLIIHTSAGDTA